MQYLLLFEARDEMFVLVVESDALTTVLLNDEIFVVIMCFVKVLKIRFWRTRL